MLILVELCHRDYSPSPSPSPNPYTCMLAVGLGMSVLHFASTNVHVGVAKCSDVLSGFPN